MRKFTLQQEAGEPYLCDLAVLRVLQLDAHSQDAEGHARYGGSAHGQADVHGRFVRPDRRRSAAAGPSEDLQEAGCHIG